MGKEIKDYLHLYYGQQVVLFKGELYYLTAKTLVEWDERFQLAIRPLSDMKEEERMNTKIRWSIVPSGYHYSPETFSWLLSKHFDLFGLIEAGLAIDARTLKLNT